jgi:hypothetical protein
MAKKIADEQKKAVEEAEAAGEELKTGNPALEPEKSNVPEPGTTSNDPGEVDVVNTDDAKSLNPNVTVSGTKPDGQGGQKLLDTVDPAIANAALIPTPAPVKPQSPSEAPEPASAKPAEGEVRFKCSADNQPFYSGGPMQKGETYVMSKEEAETLVQLKAGSIEGGAAPASADNAKPEGSDA